MTGQVLLILVGAVLAGFALLVLGLRGQRLNDHPTCRDCGFDLSGAVSGTVACPECGAGLKRARGIRIGQRRRRPLFMAIGGVLAGLPLLMIGAAGWALLTGAQIDQYKPVGLLLWEAKHTSAPRMTSIAKELNRRVAGKKLSATQRGGAIETALAIQEDASKPWCFEWGDLIEDARTDGVLSKTDEQRFRRNSPVLEWAIRPRVAPGDPIPVVAQVKEARVGSNTVLMGFASMGDAAIDGAPQSNPTRLQGARFGSDDDDPCVSQTAPFYLAGPKSPWGSWAGAGHIPITLRCPTDSSPGRHAFNVGLRTKVIVQPGGSYTWPDLSRDASGDVRVHSAALSLQTLPAGASGVEVVPPTEDLTKKLDAILRPQPITVWMPPAGSSNGTTYLSGIDFSIDGLPVSVAYDVEVKAGERRMSAGRFTSGRSADPQQGMYGPGRSATRMVQGDLSRIGKADTVTVILKPSVAAAKRTTDLTKIYGGELVFEGVEIHRQVAQGAAAAPADEKKPNLLERLFGK